MRFFNRGVNAEDAASILEVTEREINHKQQGQSQEFRYVRHMPEPTRLNTRHFQSTTAIAKPPAKSTLAARLAVAPCGTLPTCKQSQTMDETIKLLRLLASMNFTDSL